MVFQNIFLNQKKARDELTQARKKLICHMIVKNYFSNVSWKFLIKIKSIWMREIKEQAPQLALLCCGRTVRSSYQWCYIRKLFLKILQYPQETPMLGSILKTCRLQHRCFPVNIAKFLILPIFKKIFKKLLFSQWFTLTWS